jgi:hypothetical protein
MPKDGRWNPWKPTESKPATTPEQLADAKSKVDFALQELIGDLGEVTPPAASDSFLDDLDNAFRHGVILPRGETQKLSLDETRKALEEMAKPRYAQIRKNLFPQLLESAEANLQPDALATRFLRASIAEDKNELREVVKLMCQPIQ